MAASEKDENKKDRSLIRNQRQSQKKRERFGRRNAKRVLSKPAKESVKGGYGQGSYLMKTGRSQFNRKKGQDKTTKTKVLTLRSYTEGRPKEKSEESDSGPLIEKKTTVGSGTGKDAGKTISSVSGKFDKKSVDEIEKQRQQEGTASQSRKEKLESDMEKMSDKKEDSKNQKYIPSSKKRIKIRNRQRIAEERQVGSDIKGVPSVQKRKQVNRGRKVKEKVVQKFATKEDRLKGEADFIGRNLTEEGKIKGGGKITSRGRRIKFKSASKEDKKKKSSGRFYRRANSRYARNRVKRAMEARNG